MKNLGEKDFVPPFRKHMIQMGKSSSEKKIECYNKKKPYTYSKDISAIKTNIATSQPFPSQRFQSQYRYPYDMEKGIQIKKQPNQTSRNRQVKDIKCTTSNDYFLSNNKNEQTKYIYISPKKYLRNQYINCNSNRNNSSNNSNKVIEITNPFDFLKHIKTKQKSASQTKKELKEETIIIKTNMNDTKHDELYNKFYYNLSNQEIQHKKNLYNSAQNIIEGYHFNMARNSDYNNIPVKSNNLNGSLNDSMVYKDNKATDRLKKSGLKGNMNGPSIDLSNSILLDSTMKKSFDNYFFEGNKTERVTSHRINTSITNNNLTTTCMSSGVNSNKNNIESIEEIHFMFVETFQKQKQFVKENIYDNKMTRDCDDQF